MITRKSKFMSAMLSVCMTFSAVPAVYAAGDGSGASDIDGHWAKAALEEFISDGYLNGDGNGNYNPNGTMTRAQFAAIVNRILRYSDESYDISKYKDVSASAWYRSDMAKALAAAYLSGTSDETMSPEASVTREQAFVIIARILKLDTSDTSALDAYADAADVSDWAKGSVAALIKAGYVSGDDNKKLNPKKALTRAEGVTVLNRSKAALDEHKVITKGVYKDGVYTGTGAGYGGTIKVQVTIKDGKISDIQVVSQSETGSYFERAKTLLDKIKSNNGTTGISAVSGATRTSNGIFDAINACLSQAEGGKDTSTTGSTGGSRGPSGSLASYSRINYDDWYIADGSYTGVASGYGGSTSIHVTVQVTGGKIASVNIDSSAESSSYMNSAKSVIDKIIAGSTTDVDTVSGATYSANGILAAVENALDGAKVVKKNAQQPLTDVKDSDISVISDANVTAEKITDSDTIASYVEKIEGASASDVVSAYTITSSESARLMIPVGSYNAGKTYTVYSIDSAGSASALDTHIVYLAGKGYYATAAASGSGTFLLTGTAKSSDSKTYELNESKLTKGDAVTISVAKNTSKHIDTDYTINVVPYYYELDGTKYVAKVTADKSTYAAGGITGSGALQYADNTGYVENAEKSLNRQIVSILGGSLNNIDAVTGATVSANAIKQAVEGAGYSWPTEANTGLLTEKKESSASAGAVAPTIEAVRTGESQAAVKSSESLKGAVIYVDGKVAATVTDDVKVATVNAAAGSSIMVAFASGYAAETEANGDVHNSAIPASYDSETGLRVLKTDSATDEDLADFVDMITSVKANGKEYSAAAGILNENGFIDFSSPVFAGMRGGSVYSIEIAAAGYDGTLSFTVTVPETIYAYASLSYEEYWKNEGVYEADNTSSSGELDSNGEYDKGGFDAVTRATTNHGLHRGSFQQTTTVYAYDADGNVREFALHHWSADGKTMIFTDGSSAAFSRGVLTLNDGSGAVYTMKTDKTAANTEPGYHITGIKYVPVAVPAADYADFCAAYTVTQNGGDMAGGYSEKKLSSYTHVAYVEADTNGLKAATKTSGGWSFAARQTGSGTGILGQDELGSCAEPLTVKDYSGQFGEFLRADVLGDYGGQGAAMQTVRWDYYGDNDPETSKPLASYGTKFAADDWMHSQNGIQLGLTDSVRCQLPADTDGTGKWVVTIYGLGYEDFVRTIEVTSANLPAPVASITDEQKAQLTELKDQAYDLLKDYVNEDGSYKDGITALPDEPAGLAALLEHYKEAVEMLADPDATEPEAAELLGELPGLIAAVKPAA